MAINYSAPRIAARNIVTSTPNININEALGLRSSPYSGLQQVGGQNLYYGDGGFYESYSPSPVRYYTTGPFGTTSYWSSGPGGMYGGSPSYNPIFGYSGGYQRSGGDEAGTIRRDGQAFKPYTGEIPAGFVKFGDKYEPSMSYLYARSQPQVTAQPNTMFNYASGFTPATNNVYQQATGNLLTLPTMPSYSGNYGAGRFLNTGNLLGFNFTPAQTTSSPGQSPTI